MGQPEQHQVESSAPRRALRQRLDSWRKARTPLSKLSNEELSIELERRQEAQKLADRLLAEIDHFEAEHGHVQDAAWQEFVAAQQARFDALQEHYLQRQKEAAKNSNRKQEQEQLHEHVDQTPTIESELNAIKERSLVLAQAAQTVADLGLEGVDAQVQVAGLHEIGTRCEQLARDIGLTAVAEGRMSQAQLSRILGVAQMTIHRWLKEAREESDTEEQQAQASGQ